MALAARVRLTDAVRMRVRVWPAGEIVRQNVLRPGSTNVIDIDQVRDVLAAEVFPTGATVSVSLLHPNGSVVSGAAGLAATESGTTYRGTIPHTVVLVPGLIYTLIVSITVGEARTDLRERVPCLSVAA